MGFKAGRRSAIASGLSLAAGLSLLTLGAASPASASQPPGGGGGSCGDSIVVSTYQNGSDFHITVKANPIGCQIRARAHCVWGFGGPTFYETGNTVTTSGTSVADCGLDEELYGISGYQWNNAGTWVFVRTYSA
jgi:hypothetical protein